MKRLLAVATPIASLSDLITIAVAALSLTSWMAKAELLEAPAPIGGDPYEFLADDGVPSVWACDEVISVAVNLGELQPDERHHAVAAVSASIQEISRHTPFQMRMVGETSRIPTSRWGARMLSGRIGPDVIVYVGDPSVSDLWIPGSAAVGGHFHESLSDGVNRARAGFVIVDSQQLEYLRPGIGRLSRTALFIHEFLHVLGLAHTRHDASMMAPRLEDSKGVLGGGDIAGLHHLADLGCGY